VARAAKTGCAEHAAHTGPQAFHTFGSQQTQPGANNKKAQLNFDYLYDIILKFL